MTTDTRRQVGTRPIIVEKYFTARTKAHTKRHQQALEEWGGDPAAYFENFRGEVARSQRWLEKQLKDIDTNEAMGWQEKRNARVAAQDRVTRPAWAGVAPGVDCGEPQCHHDECAFLRTWGDPRDHVAMFAMQLEIQAAPMWPAMPYGDQEPIEREKTAWEQTWFTALTEPADGSIAIRPTLDLVGRVSDDLLSPESADLPIDQDVVGMTPKQAEALERICRYCGSMAKSVHGKTQHEQRFCPENPNASG